MKIYENIWKELQQLQAGRCLINNHFFVAVDLIIIVIVWAITFECVNQLVSIESSLERVELEAVCELSRAAFA